VNATWPPGLPRSLDYPDVPVGAILAGSARRFGARVAVRHGDEEMTYRQLWQRACQFANALAGRGIRRGDAVALRMPNCLAFPVAYYGVLLAGATVVPVNPLLPDDQVAAQLADAAAALTVTAADVPALCAGAPTTPPRVDIDTRHDLAHLAYTGGTTGQAKGVRLTHRNVVVNVVQHGCWHHGSLPALDDGGLVLDQVGGEGEWPVRLGSGGMVNVMPWYHAMGTIAGLGVPVLAGMTINLLRQFDPGDYLAAAERHRVTYLAGAPTMYARLLDCPGIDARDLSSVRAIGSGGAALHVETIHELHHRFPDAVICEGYGLTEATMGVSNPPANASQLHKPGTVGVAMFDTDIVVADGGGVPLAPGQPGEVRVRGPQVMQGYHNRPAATDEVLVDGWLRTGDIGILDSDGYLSIVDRAKDVVIYKGYNVYPRELEELLLSHPAVAAAAVVGRPDRVAGELPVAFVVPAGDLDAEQLKALVNDRVAPYQRLREIRAVEALPLSPAGKVLKRALRERLG
jgi:long-chain acyl-CoA synthetase